MSERASIVCPECKGTGVDDSDTPVIQVIEITGGGMKMDAPCALCFGHGRVWVRDESTDCTSKGKS